MMLLWGCAGTVLGLWWGCDGVVVVLWWGCDGVCVCVVVVVGGVLGVVGDC